MPEAFKNVYNADAVAMTANRLQAVTPRFPAAKFAALACDGLEALELKARSRQITAALDATLPANFHEAIELLVSALDPEPIGLPGEGWVLDGRSGVAGWMVGPFADWVALRGLGEIDRSLWALREMTQRFTAEFAIRPFLDAAPDQVLGVLAEWTEDESPHVRRLVSEGSRPRLPWGMRLTAFVADPSPLIPLLERLRDDDEEYVRRSVANNLNDIAKDHPDRVAAIAVDWLDDAPAPRAKLVRHALRTLIKAGHGGALAALGYGPPKARMGALEVITPVVRLGEALQFRVRLDGGGDERLIVDYAVHHQKANGSLSPKVFKWTEISLTDGQAYEATRRHPIKPITTRVYYPGRHEVELLVNGVSFGSAAFELLTD